MRTKLLENFYTETSSTYSHENKDEFACVVRLNAEHPIYLAHFENFPLAPGVCLTQIIKEVLADKLQKNLMLLNGDNIKFLAMINPNETPEFTITFSVQLIDGTLSTSATYSHNNKAYMKFKGSFQILES